MHTNSVIRIVEQPRLAVGIITKGLAAVDIDLHDKTSREIHFPLALLKGAIDFKCSDGQASFAADRTRILKRIEKDFDEKTGQNGFNMLDTRVQGIMAAAGLNRVVGEAEAVWRQFLDAVCEGNLHHLQLDLTGVDEACEQKLEQVVHALDRSELVELNITNVTTVGSWADNLASSRFTRLRRLDLRHCTGLKSLPDGLWAQMETLESLNLANCTSLEQLPAGMMLGSLKRLNLGGSGIQSLAEDIWIGLPSLEILDLSNCAQLQLIPDGLQSCSLTQLYLSECPGSIGLSHNMGGRDRGSSIWTNLLDRDTH